ncbi:hypothetical protein J6590_048954 [Homalodisca vitripennis]|nr:hypothetical protein J6590_048954 [Homalodisca vitripennis]
MSTFHLLSRNYWSSSRRARDENTSSPGVELLAVDSLHAKRRDLVSWKRQGELTNSFAVEHHHAHLFLTMSQGKTEQRWRRQSLRRASPSRPVPYTQCCGIITPFGVNSGRIKYKINSSTPGCRVLNQEELVILVANEDDKEADIARDVLEYVAGSELDNLRLKSTVRGV